MGTEDPLYPQKLQQARDSKLLVETHRDCFFLPGLVDLHIHAPQWPQLGKSLHLPLQDWLQNCTFPLEARYADLDFANSMYSSLVDALLANGTTSAVYFATVHAPATLRLAELCVEKGQRAWVGRVAMDEVSQCPDYYRDASTEAGLMQSESSIHAIQAIPGNDTRRVQPILTPRFIPSCTDAMLQGLGELALQHDCAVQTHCSESDWQHAYVMERMGTTDTASLHDFGLLTRQTVLAHANFINDGDMSLINSCGSGVAHCPLSNIYFADSVFPLRKALDKGVRVGLGTDISGGPSASQFDSCRHVISSSRQLESGTDTGKSRQERGVSGTRVDFIEAFYLATAGGADVLDVPVGKFEVGCHFDALLVDPLVDASNLMYFPDLDSWQDLFQKTLYAATRHNIAGVWVDGVRRMTT